MGAVVGIDLGTTNTVVAVVKDGQASALPDEHGERLLPSVVSFHPSGNVLVGRAAKERRMVDATNTIYSIKRLIGRSWDSEEVRRARERFPFEMREGPGQATLVVARNETYTLPEISAFVLRRAKAIAEASLGEPVDRAVITVPANFNDLQRAATKVAGRVAGLEVLRILNEPTAAALAYGYGKAANERISVYDFGGGTFDITLLDLSENVFEVLATAGNTFLGGDDIDLAIAERMADAFLSAHRYDPRTDKQAFERLRASAEVVKMRLSTEPNVTLTVPEVAHGKGGQSLDLEFSMARGELEALVGPIAEQTFDVCREALGIARLKPDDFDQVLLVGGSTRIPLVRARVEDFFRRPVLGHISPDEVVAIGAAIQAAALTGAERRRGDIPAPPKPARGSRPPGRPRTLPPGERPSRPWEPHTEPYGARPRIPTSPGLSADDVNAEAPRRPLVVQPPGGAPSQPSPHTQDRGTRPRKTTGAGLAPPPETVAGLGARGRMPTGPGLGPAANEARRRMGSVPDDTLTSASDAAARARREAARRSSPSVRSRLPSVADAGVPLPIVGTDDAGHDDMTKPAGEAIAPPMDEATAERHEVAEELARFSSRHPKVEGDRPVMSTLTSARTAAEKARRATGTSTEGGVPVYELDESELLDEGSYAGAMPDTAQIRSFASPASTDEVTQVSNNKRRTGSVVDEHMLPIPDVPEEEDDPTAQSPGAAPAPNLGTLQLGGFGTEAMPAAPAMPASPMMQQAPAPQPPAAQAGPAFGAVGQAPWEVAQPAPQPPPQQQPGPAAPLLVDVTPLSLVVETVGGFCDAIIVRNTPVPCEETRAFATAADNQTTVRVRVSQGESNHFSENTLLGEVELAGLRPAPRGQVNISVTFALDTDGILNVRARDAATGQEAVTRVRLVAVPDAANVAAMTARHAGHNVVG